MIPVKVLRINNKEKFIVDEKLMPDVFGVGEIYEFDLSHPSNFDTNINISKNSNMLKKSEETKLIGTPGFSNSKLIFQPDSIGNRYIYDSKYGLIYGSMLNPLILLKDIDMYDCESDITSVIEYVRPQLYEFNINADINKITVFINSLNKKINGLNLDEKNCPEIFSYGKLRRCEESVIDNKINKENLSTARSLVKQIKYGKGKFNKIQININSFGKKLGGPSGFGMAPKNIFT